METTEEVIDNILKASLPSDIFNISKIDEEFKDPEVESGLSPQKFRVFAGVEFSFPLGTGSLPFSISLTSFYENLNLLGITKLFNMLHYSNEVQVKISNQNYHYFLKNKPTKTITIKNYDGFSIKINRKDLKISPTTYWRISGYDAQFEGNDANCWLCGWYGMDYGTCKCKESFTEDEHRSNIVIARRNMLSSVIGNYLPEYLSQIKSLSDYEINSLCEGYNINFPIYNWDIKKHDTSGLKEYISKRL